MEDINKITQNQDDTPFLELYERYLFPYIIKQDPEIVKYEDLFKIYFDSAVLKEGELPLLKLTESISKGKTLEDVPNLLYYNNGKIHSNEILPSEDINSLPTPCFDGLPFNLYLNPELVLPILASRGCYWGKCAFCSHRQSYQGHYQNRSPAKLVNDLQELSQKYNVRHFAFSDEAISPSCISDLADEIINKGINNIRCSSNVRFERQFTPELCEKIYKAGFRLLYFGLESGCNRVLDHMQKGTNKDLAIEVCKNVYNAGIWDHVYCFLGFPTETRSEAQETIDFLISNKNIIHSFNLDNFILAKGALLLSNPEKYGIKSIDTSSNNDFNFAYTYSVSAGLTAKEAMELSIISRQKIANEYRSDIFFKLECEDVLLYVSHFEKSNPYLKSTQQKEPNKVNSKIITRDSIPKINHSVVLDTLHFNIMDIINNIVNYKKLAIYPISTYSIFNPAQGKIWAINTQIKSILNHCDGKTNILQIVNKVLEDDHITLSINECITTLNSLWKEGYISF
jgi:radical SAM superfamily enzyme YgiQ (UPF0313 family)